jgi:hypothetical protein
MVLFLGRPLRCDAFGCAGRLHAGIAFGLLTSRSIRRGLVGTGNAGILSELVDVAVRRAEMHPAVTARVFLFKENLDSAGPELAGGSINVVYKKADNWSGGEVAVHLAVGSKDLHFAAIRQLEDLKPWTIKVCLEAQDVFEEVGR